MGTRGAIGFRVNGIDKVTYNHWDSYPSHLGVKMATLVAGATADELRQAARRVLVIKGDEPITPAMKEKYAQYADVSVGEQTTDDWYCLLRNLQGELKEYVYGDADVMVDGSDFLLDSLFCEWAYIINCDSETLEVYRGFVTEPFMPGRYANLKRERSFGGTEYHGVRLLRTIPWEALAMENAKDIMESIQDREGFEMDAIYEAELAAKKEAAV